MRGGVTCSYLPIFLWGLSLLATILVLMADTNAKKPVGRKLGSKNSASSVVDVTLGELRSLLNDKDSVSIPVKRTWLKKMQDLLGV